MLQRGWWALCMQHGAAGGTGALCGGAAGGSTHRHWEPCRGPRGVPSTQPGHDTGHWAGRRAEPCAAAGPCRPLGSPSRPGTWQGTGCGVTPPALTHLRSAQAAPFLLRHLPGRPAHVVVPRFSPKLRDWHQALPLDLLWAAKLPAPVSRRSSSHLTPAATLRFTPRTKKNPQSTFCI